MMLVLKPFFLNLLQSLSGQPTNLKPSYSTSAVVTVLCFLCGTLFVFASAYIFTRIALL